MKTLAEKKVLDKGYVKLLRADKEDVILEVASICYGKTNLPESKKTELLKRLYKEHAGNPTSSFEFVNFTFKVKCPIFIARQWFRHRIGSYQELSRRYTKASIDDVYIPEELEGFLKDTEGNIYYHYAHTLLEKIFDYYETLLQKGFRKEIARFILPLGLYTEFYWQVNLRSLINFLKVRFDRHAQKEIREYAKAILELIEPYCPVIISLLKQDLSIK